jgi:transcriptional regulator with XRE-family HTH domain
LQVIDWYNSDNAISKYEEVASMPATMVHIGERLKKQRTRRALTQAELAERADVTTATVARIERDEIEPRMTTLRKLARALEVDPAELVEG